MRNKALAALALVGLVAASPAYAAVELVQNGDFQTVAAGSTGLAGWVVNPGQVNPPSDIISAKGADYVANAGASASANASANIFASFGPGNRTNISTLISSPFDTVAGQLYQFSFDFAQFGVAGSETLTYIVGGLGILSSGTVSQVGGTDLDTIFKHYTTTFIGSGSAANVSFTMAGSPTNDVDGLLDNVSVVGVTSSVPEASTWTLLILGFGILGVACRRRNKGMASYA